jgi:two-component system, NtrC family, sensor histidine kinase HydH
LEIGVNRKYTGALLFLVLGFFILGLGLIALTWQNLRQQQEHVLDQLEITGRAIIRSVEANLYRGIFRGMGPGRWADDADFSDLARDVLEELVAEGDVVFLDISGIRGRLFISRYEGASGMFEPSGQMLEEAEAGLWKDKAVFMGREVFIMGVPARRMDMMSRSRRTNLDEQVPDSPSVIFIALDMSNYLDVYSRFKRTIFFQTLFTLGAILLFWFLLLAFLRRREQGHEFLRLQTFHSRLLDNMPDGLLSVDQNRVVTSANPAAREILETGPEIVGQKLSRAMPRNVDIGAGMGWTQMDLPHKSLEILFLPIREEEQSLVLIRDRTRMKELEKDLEHSRDLAALGRFAAGLAHEIRNPLSSLKGFAQYFTRKFYKDDPAYSYARTMVMEADRLNRVVTDLLYLARPRPVDPVLVDLGELFGEVTGLLQSDLTAGKCEIIIDVQAGTARADRDLLKQALINLVLNSVAAVDDDGQVILRSKMSGNMLEICVIDNGHGMDSEIRDRAMEPFYSAREKGTGLGLAIVQRIAGDHRGKLVIESAPGEGTSVCLMFPYEEGISAYEE